MASAYIEIIKSVQMNGSYIIGGWSFGGIVAYEIVKQMEMQGDKIDKLLLIDAYNISSIDSEALCNHIDQSNNNFIINKIATEDERKLRLQTNLNNKLALKYRPNLKIKCEQVHLLKALTPETDAIFQPTEYPYNAWEDYIEKSKLNITYIYAKHNDLFSEKNVKEVAAFLEKSLNEKEKDSLYTKN